MTDAAIDTTAGPDDPRAYLNSLSSHQGRPGDTTLLHPDFASRMAGAIRDARAMGLNVGLESGYRSSETTGSRYDASGNSLHGYGAAADVNGIGPYGSPTAELWKNIAQAHGLYNPYINDDAKPGTFSDHQARAEYNHWQLIPDKLENRPDITDAINKTGGDKTKIWNAISPIQNVNQNSLLGYKGADLPTIPDAPTTTVPANLPPQGIANLLKAYQTKAMPDDARAAFEKDVAAGKIMLPQGVALGGAATKPSDGAFEVPQTLVDNYNAAAADPYNVNKMPQEARQQMDRDLASGKIRLPSGAVLNQTYPSLVGRAIESVTGAQRQTAATKNLPDFSTMPELNSLSNKVGFLTGGDSNEVVNIIRNNNPDVQAVQDEKGNWILKSGMNGQEYVVKPGATTNDLIKYAAIASAFMPASRAATVLGAASGSAATQAGLETAKAASGGTFDPASVATAGAMGAGVPLIAKAVGAVASPARRALGAVVGKGAAPEAAPVAGEAAQPAAAEMAGAPPIAPTGGAGPATVDATLDTAAAAPHAAPVEAPAPAPAAPAPASAAEAPLAPEAVSVAPPVTPLPDKELVGTAKTAGTGVIGSANAKQVLAEQAAPDAETVAAAKRLGIENFLQPEHVTTNQVYRELAEGIKSIPGSEANAQSMAGLAKVAERANSLIDELGGTHDLGQISADTQAKISAARQAAEDKADELYKQIREAIPAKTPAPADNVLSLIKARADELGSASNLSSMEKQILSKLNPKQTQAPMPEAPTGRITPQQYKDYQAAVNAAQGGTVAKQPTYALLDDVRRNLGNAYRNRGPFANSDTHLVDTLYGALSKDQEAVANANGMSEVWTNAKKATQLKKGIENDLTSLFGKNVDRSMVPQVNTAMNALSGGNHNALLNLLKHIPTDMRQKVVASGLASAFGKNARNNNVNFGSFARWYENLQKNKQSFDAVMSNLPPEARQQLQDLYRVAKGISLATREHITTGRVAEITKKFNDTDNLIGNVYKAAHHVGKAVAMETVSSAIGMHGAGLAAGIASALNSGKTTAIQAADKLIASPSFKAAVTARASGATPQQMARRIAYSREFILFARAVNNRDIKNNKEQWLLNAINAHNSNNEAQ